MTIEELAKNYVREVRTALKKLPKEQRENALYSFVRGFLDMAYDQKSMPNCQNPELNPELKPFYEKGKYAGMNLSESEIGVAGITIIAEVDKIRKGLSRKTLWERLWYR